MENCKDSNFRDEFKKKNSILIGETLATAIMNKVVEAIPENMDE